MTRKEALQDLLVKVKAGTSEFPQDFNPLGPDWPNGIAAYRGSMDAALSLFEAVLPGWVKWDMSHGYFGYECAITNRSEEAYSCDKTYPARALLIATIEALVEMEE